MTHIDNAVKLAMTAVQFKSFNEEFQKILEERSGDEDPILRLVRYYYDHLAIIESENK